MKHRPHALELIGDLPGFLFAGVGGYDEVLAANFYPVFGLVAAECRVNRKQQSDQKGTSQQDTS
jgi:hypothetical protein